MTSDANPYDLSALVAVALAVEAAPDEDGGPAAGITAAVARAVAWAEQEASPGAMLIDLVRGARIASDQLRELELEAARQARVRKIPLRALAAAAGMSERSAATRYKTVPVWISRENNAYDGPQLTTDTSSPLLPIIDRLHHADLYAEPLYTEDHGLGADLHGLGLSSEQLEQVLAILDAAGYTAVDADIEPPEDDTTDSEGQSGPVHDYGHG